MPIQKEESPWENGEALARLMIKILVLYYVFNLLIFAMRLIEMSLLPNQFRLSDLREFCYETVKSPPQADAYGRLHDVSFQYTDILFFTILNVGFSLILISSTMLYRLIMGLTQLNQDGINPARLPRTSAMYNDSASSGKEELDEQPLEQRPRPT